MKIILINEEQSQRFLKEATWNFHHGKNHDMTPYKSENKYVCYHETGQFGSGTYFSTYNTDSERTNDMEKYVKNNPDKNPEFIQVGESTYRVDMDLYKNLYRVYSEKQGDILHTMCSYLNGFYHKVSGYGLGYYQPKNSDFDNARIYQIIRLNSSSLGLKCPSYLQLTRMAQKHAQSEEKQSFSTLFMEWNGFNGVNVSGVKKFDNTRHGSVIYNISKTSLEPVEHDSTSWFNNVGYSHTNTIAARSSDDARHLLASLTGDTSYGFDELDNKTKLRLIKNIFSSNNLGLETVSLLLFRCQDNQQLMNYMFKQLFNPNKVDPSITLDSKITDYIIKHKQYYFINYQTPESYHGWRGVNFLEDFLSDYKWSNWNATNQKLKEFLDFLLTQLKRPLTRYEKEYIEEDYYNNEEEK